MTIDTKELRRLAQAASHPTTKGRWIRLFGERTVYDRMEDGCRGIPVVSTDKHPPSSFEAACLDFIAAANPAVINSLLERLEAAESDALEQARLNGMGSEREAALMAKLEAAEKERDALRALVVMRFDHDYPPQFTQGHDLHELTEPVTAEHCRWFVAEIERLRTACDALRAKIEAMERQEPAGYGVLHVEAANGEEDWDSLWKHRVFAEDHVKDFVQAYSDLGESVGAITVVPLYLAPGAKGE